MFYPESGVRGLLLGNKASSVPLERNGGVGFWEMSLDLCRCCFDNGS
jgi:hypothetical protein